jgi:hypothetical protein
MVTTRQKHTRGTDKRGKKREKLNRLDPRFKGLNIYSRDELTKLKPRWTVTAPMFLWVNSGGANPSITSTGLKEQVSGCE